MSTTFHLQRRGDSLHYVRRVPVHLVQVVCKKFIKKSFGKVDLAQAKQLRTIEDLRCDALFAELETKAGDGKQLIAHRALMDISLDVVIAYIRKSVEEDDKQNATWFVQEPPADLGGLNERRNDAHIELAMLQNPGNRTGQEWISRATDRAFAALGRTVTDGEFDAAAAEFVRRGLVEVTRRRSDRYHDRNDRTFHDALFDPDRTASMTFEQAADTHLAEKLKHYAENGIREKSADRLRAAGGFLKEIIGLKTAVADIDDDKIQGARESIARTPANRSKFYPNLSLQKQIERAAQDKKPVLSANTQSFYLDCLRDILQMAVRKRVIPFNPAADVKPLKLGTLSPEEKRLPLTPAQLKQFFEGSFYRSCAPDAPKPYVQKNRPWRFWLPLLMLFSGARPNEILQLDVEDIKRTEAGTWYLDLQDDNGSKQLKTKSSRRRVPIHPEIVKLGFLAFVEERRKAQKGTGPRLFYTVTANKYGSYSDTPSKAFNRTYIRQETVLSSRQALYSLRHNVRDALRRAKAPPEALRIAGWAIGQSVSDHYGDPGNPDLNAEHVAAISYPGLDLTFLHLPVSVANGP